MPTEPKLSGRPSPLAQEMKPCRSRGGFCGGTTTMFGTSAIMPTAAKSFSGSNGMFACSHLFAACDAMEARPTV